MTRAIPVAAPLFAAPLVAAMLVAAACSAQSPVQAPVQSAQQDGSGPQGPQSAGANQPLPKNAPAATIRNVPATGGRANRPQTPPPFTVTEIGRFESPFALAVLPDGGALVTEKAGRLKMRGTDGGVAEVAGVPAVVAGGQGGLLDVAIAPDFARTGTLYLSFAEPRPNGGSSLALMRARLSIPPCTVAPCTARLADQQVIWRAGSDGPGGQFGATIAFAPDGRSLFLSSGERQRFTPAQDPEQALGKILRLTLDGKAWPGNPDYKAGGVRAQIWSSGHRNPYGLVFTADGRLWEEEMGPKGGDELNLIEPGRNYGWPVVSNGDNYSGQPIPDHPSRPDLAAPKLWWNPSISPGGMMDYRGTMFPQYRGSLFIAAMSTPGLIRVTVNGDKATPAEFWDFGTRIRDVAEARDGAIWLLEDGRRDGGGRLLRLTPKP